MSDTVDTSVSAKPERAAELDKAAKAASSAKAAKPEKAAKAAGVERPKKAAKPEKAASSASSAKPAKPQNAFVRRMRRLGKRIFKPAHPVFTVALLVAFVAIIAVVIYLVMQMGTYTINDPLYRYNTSIRQNYQGESKIYRSEANDGKVTFTMHNGGEVIELTEKHALATAPLYWQNEDRLFLPQMMSVVRPSKGVQPMRTGYYTEIRRDGDGFIAHVDNHDVRLTEGFLFDGQSVYVFLEEVTIDYLNQSVKMPPLSYAVVVPGQRIELYPYQGTPVVEQISMISVSARSGVFLVDLTNDALQIGGQQYLLFTTPSILEVIQE